MAMRKLTDGEKRRVHEPLADLVGINSAVTSADQANRDRTEERTAAHLTRHLTRLAQVSNLCG